MLVRDRRGDHARLLVVQPKQPSLGKWDQACVTAVRVVEAAESSE